MEEGALRALENQGAVRAAPEDQGALCAAPKDQGALQVLVPGDQGALQMLAPEEGGVLRVLAPARFLADEVAEMQRMMVDGRRVVGVCAEDFIHKKLNPELIQTIEVVVMSEEVINGEEPNFVPGLLGKLFGMALRCQNLRWLHCGWVGLDAKVFDSFREKGVRISNSPGVNAIPISHTAMAGVLILARGFLNWGYAQRRREWMPISNAVSEGHKVRSRRQLRGQRAVLLGMGAIGKEIAKQLQFYGMRVEGVQRSPAKGDEPVECMWQPAQLLDAVAGADWLVCALPSTAQTVRIVSATVLHALADGACVVNIGRGGVIDEGALINALQSGKLFGAYLDVFATEPLPPESPLWDLRNVIISPHNAAYDSGNTERGRAIFHKNFEQYVAGASRLPNEELRSDQHEPKGDADTTNQSHKAHL